MTSEASSSSGNCDNINNNTGIRSKFPFIRQLSSKDSILGNDLKENLHHYMRDFFINLFFFIPGFVVYFLFFPPVYILRCVMNLIAMFIIKGEPCVPSFLSPTELFFYTKRPSSSLCCLTFSKSMSKQKFCKLLRKRIFHNSYPRFAYLFKRFQQIVASSCYNFYWIDFPDFDVENHVELKTEIENENDLKKFMLLKYSYPDFKNLPLWRIYVIENFGSQSETLVICQFHSVLVDGTTLVTMLEDFLCDPLPRKVTAEKSFAYRSFINNAVISIFTAPSVLINMYRRKHNKNDILKQIYQENNDPSGENNSTEQELIVNRQSDIQLNYRCELSSVEGSNQFNQISFAEPIPAISLQKLRLVSKATVTDIYLSCITGALKSQIGDASLADIRCLLPINIRNPTSDPTVEPNLSFMSPKLAGLKEGMIPSLWETKLSTQMSKFASEMSIFAAVLQIFWCLTPYSFIAKFCHHVYSKNLCQLSSLASSPLYLSMDGSVIKSVYFCMAPISDISLGFNLISYGDMFYLSVTAKNDLPIDCNRLCEDINSQVCSKTKQKNMPLPLSLTL